MCIDTYICIDIYYYLYAIKHLYIYEYIRLQYVCGYYTFHQHALNTGSIAQNTIIFLLLAYKCADNYFWKYDDW